MNEEAANIWNKISEIKDAMELHQMTREDAFAQAEPLVAQLNGRTIALHEKYGKKTPKSQMLTVIKAFNSPLLTRSVGETKRMFEGRN